MENIYRSQISSINHQEKNARLTRRLLLTVVGMFVFSIAVLPPFYSVICRVTGLNGKTSSLPASAQNLQAEQERVIKVQFLASSGTGSPWVFTPEQAHVQVHPGEATIVKFSMQNLIGETVFSQAVPSVSPAQAAAYLKKIQCFCFERQQINGGEKKIMPVVFYVDPNLPKDIQTITLSYTAYLQPSPQLTMNDSPQKNVSLNNVALNNDSANNSPVRKSN